MPADRAPTFYDVLDVPHDANEAEVALAYRRVLARMRSEPAAPNPRLLATAKVAHETATGTATAPPASQAARAPSATTAPPAPPAQPAATAPAPAPRASGGGMGTMVGEGFTTLWREDEDLQISEVLDDAKQGYIGLPLAYWTRWEGRDPERSMTVGCRISIGDVPVYAYQQGTQFHQRDGYFYCALAPTMLDLNTLPKGEYTFEIFVNGRPVAESSIRVERRIMTPTAWMVVTLLVGMGLLAFLRRNRTPA